LTRFGRFEIDDTPLAGAKILRRLPIADSRGFLERIFCTQDLAGAGFTFPIAQINRTLTRKAGTVRGLHYQVSPSAEDKLVMCLRGDVFDVAVDVRHGSPTFMHWHACQLSADNGLAYLIPKGFAHGFQTLVDNCELLYLHTAAYDASAEAALNVLDPRVGIEWPLPITDASPKDRAHPLVQENFYGIR
jgi:dTDP-4-dehydrorhamnose 3,5-epimerase